MRFFITGSRGFIGTALSDALNTVEHFDIKDTILNNVSYANHLSDCIEKSDPDVVVHLAAMAGVVECTKNPAKSFDTNVQGAFNVLSSVRRFDIERTLLISSCGVGICPTPYHVGKRFMEDCANAFSKSYQTTTCILRLSNVYGPGSINKNSVVASFFKEAINTGIITVEGDGTQTRDFIYIDDVVKQIISAAQGSYNGILPIASGMQTSILSVAIEIAKLTGAKITHAAKRSNDPKSNNVDVSKAHYILNVSNTKTMDDGLKQTYEYFKKVRGYKCQTK